MDHNYIFNYSADVELLGCKNADCNWVANVCVECDGRGLNSRQGGFELAIWNYFDGSGTTAAAATPMLMKGGDKSHFQEAVIFGAYATHMQASQGMMSFVYTSDDNEYPQDKVVVIGAILHDSSGPMIEFRGNNTEGVADWAMIGLVGWTTDPLVSEATPAPANVFWSGSCYDTSGGGGHGLPTLPTGLVGSDVSWEDRGDGVMVPLCADHQLGEYDHNPFALESPQRTIDEAGCVGLTGC